MKEQECMEFDGRTFNKRLDGKRIRKQLDKVYELMKDGAWRSLRQIAEITGYPEGSISARLRDFRKPKFGGYVVNLDRRYDSGIFCEFIYQLWIA